MKSVSCEKFCKMKGFYEYLFLYDIPPYVFSLNSEKIAFQHQEISRWKVANTYILSKYEMKFMVYQILCFSYFHEGEITLPKKEKESFNPSSTYVNSCYYSHNNFTYFCLTYFHNLFVYCHLFTWIITFSIPQLSVTFYLYGGYRLSSSDIHK